MTIQEAILSRSPLPKDGTYTLLEHLFATDVKIAGTPVGLSVATGVEVVKVQVAKANIKVNEAIIAIRIDAVNKAIGVNNDTIDVRIVNG